MTALPAVLAFVAAAGLLTLTPGLDTALVLRTAAAEGPRRAMAAAVGIGAGCLVWGLAAALGAGVTSANRSTGSSPRSASAPASR